MLKTLKISNFKSIQDDSIELGRVNVFIGENGSGKSNILEALAIASAAKEDKLDVEGLYSKGIRVAKPALTFSSFRGKKQKNEIVIDTKFEIEERIINPKCVLYPTDKNDIFSKWVDINKIVNTVGFRDHLQSLKNKLNDTFLSEENINKNFIEIFEKKYEEILNEENYKALHDFVIYTLNIKSLRGIYNESRKTPLGLNGENLDVVIADLSKEERQKIKEYNYLISWLEDFNIDEFDINKMFGLKLGKSTSKLYFSDKYMQKQNNVFSAENANEGVLHLLFYLVLFISKKTPVLFGIDNIESSLNPHLCRKIMELICQLAKSENKQVLITTHNPAVLDGLNLFDDEIRLFEVFRNDAGNTKTQRITLNPDAEKKFKLSELWMNGSLGAISQNF